jgi:hypothetical protein
MAEKTRRENDEIKRMHDLENDRIRRVRDRVRKESEDIKRRSEATSTDRKPAVPFRPAGVARHRQS